MKIKQYITKAMDEIKGKWNREGVPFNYRIDHFEHNLNSPHKTYRISIAVSFTNPVEVESNNMDYIQQSGFVTVISIEHVGSEEVAWEFLLHHLLIAGWDNVYQGIVNMSRNPSLDNKEMRLKFKDYPLTPKEMIKP